MTDSTESAELARRYADAIHDGRLDDAAALLNASGDVGSAETAAALAAAVDTLFQQHDLARMVAAAELGLAWCLARASDSTRAEAAPEMKKRAQAIAFNAAANCWPGWDDAGVVIDDDHVARGLALARRSFDLVRELEFGADRIGTAHWLVGALELAAGQLESAQASFAHAQRAYEVLGVDSAESLMAQGYRALARKVHLGAQGEAERDLVSVIERLRALEGKKGAFFADQIATADRVFDARSVQR